MAEKAPALLMLKLDGLTIKLVYEKGQLVEASTRGDGDIGEVITHNIPAFYNVPVKKPHKGRLVETLYCDNPDCSSQILHKFIHFVEKKAMDIPMIGKTAGRGYYFL